MSWEFSLRKRPAPLKKFGVNLFSVTFLPCHVRWESNPRGFDSHRGQKIFSLPRVVPCFPILGLTPCGLFMGLSSTLIYTSELILCFTIYVIVGSMDG